MMSLDSHRTLRFGDFTLDNAAYELRDKGRVVRLERQPMDVLILLVERRGQLVTRADIVERLWGPDVFVDVETGVHTAIRKIRRVLRDSPDAPRFVETVPGKGYRFVAPVGVEDPAVVPAGVAAIPPSQSSPSMPTPSFHPRFAQPLSPGAGRKWAIVATVALALAAFAALGWARHWTRVTP